VTAELPFLALIVLVAFTVQGALGFGASLLVLALGALRVPIPELLPVLVPLHCVGTAAVLRADRAHVDRRLLLGWILPLMTPGVLLGALLAGSAADGTLRRAYGGLVVLLALHGLWRLRRAEPAGPGSRATRLSAIVGAGLVHGVFATGGPLLVLAVDGERLEPRAFRGTLAGAWLTLNLLLTLAYAGQGRLGAGTLGLSAALLPSVGVGLLLGHAVHTRLEPTTMRAGVLGLLVVAGAHLAA
jgi:uncharacterized membrane protein YfcA